MAITLARLTTDRTTTTNVLIDVTGLGLAVSASTDYAFRFVVHVVSVAATTGIRLSVNGPASPTAIRFGGIVPLSSAGANFGSVSTYDAAIFASTSGSTTDVMCIIEGVFRNGSTQGTLACRFSGELTNSTVTVRANSHGILIPI